MDFVKMHGLGNDFIVIEDMDVKTHLSPNQVIRLCDRHFGIGADGLMLVRPSELYDIRMVFYNQDGTEAAMCGNGVRCFARYIYDHGIVNQSEFSIETIAGKITPKILGDMIQVNMGKADFSPQSIPVEINQDPVFDKQLEIDGEEIVFSSLLVGVPHTIIEVENIDEYPIVRIGPMIESHRLFPQKTNVNFVEILKKDEMKVKTWERGAGFTLACGTGASAAVAVLNKKNKVTDNVLVHLPGGELRIKIVQDNIYMIGSAKQVFTGHIDMKQI